VDLDSRAFITLRRVVTDPGALTREYAAGHFIRQLPPVRLYLVVSAVYFFLAPLVGNGMVRLAGGAASEGWAQLGPLGWDSEILLLLLIPLWAMAGRLLLGRQTRAFEEVFVFSVHYQVFFLLVVVAGGALGALLSRGGSIAVVVAVFVATLLVPFIYLVRALRIAFGLSGLRLAVLSTALYFLHLLGGQLLQNVT
jgi:hypothetical protein